jgi:hypothetical protein
MQSFRAKIYGAVVLLALGTLTETARPAPNVLNLGPHADTYIAPAINAVLGSGVVDSAIYVDYKEDNSLADLTQYSAETYSVASGTQINHAPYGVANFSYCCSKGEGDDPIYYQTLYGAHAILSTTTAFVVGGQLPVGEGPPTYSTATSSPNSANGGSGWGIEFGLSANYLHLDTSEDSWDSAGMAGLLAALMHDHPSWTWFDVKAAFRQTASNWHVGYSHTAFGYGYVSWNAADAITSSNALYLQPPGMQIFTAGNTATVTLYPFRQTRRAYEVVYSINPSQPRWLGKNEFSAADVSSLGGTLVYTSNGTDITPIFTTTIPNATPLTLVAFTTDGIGHFSRLEEFSAVSTPTSGNGEPLPLWGVGILGFGLAGIMRRQHKATISSVG